MYCIGLDIVEVARIKRILAHWGDRFLKRVYTEAEIELCQDRVPELAARFAGKEAVMKALGVGIGGVTWREIEILGGKNRMPLVHLHGRAHLQAEELGIERLVISLSHSKEYAIAIAAEGKR